MEDVEILTRPVDLSRMSVATIGGLYRVLYHASFGIGRALAGFSPAVEPLSAKWALVEAVHGLMEHSRLYAERLPEVRVSLRLAAVPSRECVEVVEALCAVGSWEAALAWTGKALRDLHELASEAVSSSAGVALHHDRRILRRVRDELSEIISLFAVLDLAPFPDAGRAPLREIPPMDIGTSITGAFPLKLAPRPVRAYPPETMTVNEPVTLVIPPKTPDALAAFLHDNLQIEFIAIDIPLRNIADFTGMPLQFYVDMARHAHDEMRHCKLLLEQLGILGARLGSFPFSVPDKYQVLIGQDLVYRLVILSRTGEGEAIEFIGQLLPTLETSGFHDAARMFDYVLSDETRHALYGNRWVRYLVGESDVHVDQVTRSCLERYNRLAREVGLLKDPQRDPDYLSKPRPRGVDLQIRELAGFTPGELERLANARSIGGALS